MINLLKEYNLHFYISSVLMLAWYIVGVIKDKRK